MSEVFSGTVRDTVYENDGFHIVRVILDDSVHPTVVGVKGNFPGKSLKVGDWISFEGKWDSHPQYGRQLKVLHYPAAINDWTDQKVLSALRSNGIGPSIRRSLAHHAKREGQSLQALMDSGDLSGVTDLEHFTKAFTLMKWRSLRTYMDGASFMASAGIPKSVIQKVWETFGTDLQDILLEDPWVLVQVAGISFKEADQIAQRLGVAVNSPGRIQGAVLSAVQETLNEGHVFAMIVQVVTRVLRHLSGSNITPRDIAESITLLVKDGVLILDQDHGVKALYDKHHYNMECDCARMLYERVREPIDEQYLTTAFCRVSDRVSDSYEEGNSSVVSLGKIALETWSAGRKMTLIGDQVGAALDALTQKISVISGLPGTGKTTTLRAVVGVCRDMQIPFLLVAPTGIAAKRMASVTGAEASTIHRAFGAKGQGSDDSQERAATYLGIVGDSVKKSQSSGEEDWGYGPSRLHPARVVIVDESSMLDLHMLWRLLSGTSLDCQIIFVGDPYQLPSVGSGDILRDLIQSGVFPHTHLSKIFRQEDTSGIVLAAHAVHAGHPPTSDKKDFIILPGNDEEGAAEIIVEIARRLYAKRENFQVLSPRHGGPAGVTALNAQLRVALNPSGQGVSEMRLGGSVVREGDRVMVTRNNYTLNVYNGDVGKISHIDRRAKEVQIKIFEGPGQPPRLVRYKFSDATRALRLAYCQTVHKSQGQEYNVIVLPVLNAFGRQLQRNLFYTAITRAKKRVLIVGTSSAISRAVHNNQAEARNTLLADRVRKLLQGPKSD